MRNRSFLFSSFSSCLVCFLPELLHGCFNSFLPSSFLSVSFLLFLLFLVAKDTSELGCLAPVPKKQKQPRLKIPVFATGAGGSESFALFFSPIDDLFLSIYGGEFRASVMDFHVAGDLRGRIYFELTSK